MSIIVPPLPVPYPATLSGQPTKLCVAPPEGPRMVRVPINFSTQAGSQACVSVNLQNISSATNPISQIASIYVDNSANTNQVNIYFPDTQYFLQLPAKSQGYYPVQTNTLQFTCWNSAVNTNDSVRLFVMNNFVTNYEVNENTLSQVYLLGSNGAQYQEVAGDLSSTIFANIPSSGTTSTQLIAPGTLFTVRSAFISLSNFVSPNFYLHYFIGQSTGSTFLVYDYYKSSLGVPGYTGVSSIQLFNQTNLQIPFPNRNGLYLFLQNLNAGVSWDVSTKVNVNMLYTIIG